jgi:ribosomal-protein-alanine N-acetyltransferase
MFGLFSRSPECLILEVEMKDAATLSRIHGEAFARAWGDGEFQSLVSQASVFGYLACPEGPCPRPGSRLRAVPRGSRGS